ncbi:unnamed protein product [Brassica oleracea]
MNLEETVDVVNKSLVEHIISSHGADTPLASVAQPSFSIKLNNAFEL